MKCRIWHEIIGENKKMSEKLTNLFLKRRGYTNQVLHDINNGKHQKLLNIDYLCQILKSVHDSGQKIVVMPDFDADGTTAGTLGYAGLSELGFNVGLYQPDERKGYGIHVSDIKTLISRFPDVKYIITCDVGITCYDAFKYAYEHNIKVLITDHHEEKKDKPMPLLCETIVNPCQLKETYPLRDICGAFVFWQVLDNYAKTYADNFTQEQISRLRVFAGIGTEGDSMPLVKENRILLRQAISLLRFIYNNGSEIVVDSLPGTSMYKRAFRGLFDLLKALDKSDKMRGKIDEDFLGFYVVPVFNSIKRMELPMSLVFGTFFADYQTQIKYAQKMVETNDLRKESSKHYDEVLQSEIEAGKQPLFPYVFTTDAPAGIIGLIAQKQMNRTNKPTFIVNKKDLSGSGRTPSYFEAIKEFPESNKWELNGHQCAFGIKFAQIDNMSEFKKLVAIKDAKLKQAKQTVKRDYDIALASELFSQNIKFDDVINLDDCWDFYHDTQKLRPFGSGFNQPVVKILFDSQHAQFKIMGQNSEHLKVILPNKLELIAWNKADELSKLKNNQIDAFYGYFSVNSFRGKISLQMIGDFKNEEQKAVSD